MSRDEEPILILIAGVARSGSTAVDFILGNRHDSFSLGEVHAAYRPFRSHHLSPNCNCGEPISRCPVWARTGLPPAKHLHRAIADAHGARVVIDSSKSLGWVRDAARWAAADGMRVELVLPWRGAKAVAASYWKRGAPGWSGNLIGYMRRLQDLSLPWSTLYFDDLIADPQAALDSVYLPLGLRYERGQEEFWKGEFHSLFGSGGTRSQVTAGRSQLSPPAFSAEFEAYWANLPSGVVAAMTGVEEAVREGGRNGHRARRRLPPRWYWKHRLVNLRDKALLARDPSRDVR